MSVFRRIMLSGQIDISKIPDTRKLYYTATSKVEPKKDTLGSKIIINKWSSSTGEGVIVCENDITSIGSSAFYFCNNLISITIPNNVTSIGSSAFYECGSLTSITIPDSVTSIGYQAFYNCDSLTSITIPDSVTKIEKYAFYGCTGELTVNCNIPSASSSSNGAFYNSKFTKVTFGDSVTSIGSYAFYNCSSLTSATIPDSVTEIEVCAFQYCSSLASITIPDSVTEIGGSAFRYCSRLKSVYITDLSAWCKIVFATTDSNPLTNGAKLYLNGAEVTELVIPSDITEIKNHTFLGCTSLTSVTIPNSVTSIGEDAFRDCDALKSVTIPNSVTSIGYQAFYSCDSLTSVYYQGDLSAWCKIDFENYSSNPLSNNAKLYLNGAEVTDMTIPSDITSIGKYTFYGCSSLTSVTIPNSVTEIGKEAFYGCTGELIVNCNIPSASSYENGTFYSSRFTKVTFGDSVTSIGSYAFYNCDSLTSIVIPDSITEIGQYAFAYCSGELIINCNIPNGSINSRIFYGSNFTKVTIGNSVTSIGSYAFNNCNILTSMTIGNGVTEIGKAAFYECGGELIVNCNIPNGLTSSDNAFYYSNFTKITIGDSVTSIGYQAFWNCTLLTSVTIPNSVTSIGSHAFYECGSLTSVYYQGDLSAWCKYNFDGYASNPLTNGAKLYLNGAEVTDMTIPSDITSIGKYAFHGCSSLTSVTIPNSVTSIGEGAFRDCTSLTSVTIPDSVTEIGNQAFYYCSSLTSITIPNSVTSIGDSAFCNCSSLSAFYGKYTSTDNRCLIVDGVLNFFAPANLTEYVIPDSVTSIGYQAFYSCDSLTSITIPDSITEIGQYAFAYCRSLISIVIPNSVTEIGEQVFRDCTSLASVTIPNSVTSIGYQAFYSCGSLTSVYCSPTTPPRGGSNMFNNNHSSRKIYVPYNSRDAYKTAQYWSNYADSIIGCDFEDDGEDIDTTYSIMYTSSDGNVVTPHNTDGFGANITNNGYVNGQGIITFDGDVTSIGSNAFNGCSNLANITIPDSVTEIGSNAFNGCSRLTSVTIPDSVASIGGDAFYGCTSLTSITIPNNVTEIGDYTFYGCSNLKSVTIPDSVTEIGDYTFYGCSSLTSVTIPDSVTSIGSNAFNDCSNLTNIYCKSTTPPSGGSSMFSNNTSDRKIYVPHNSVDVYKTADYWSSYADSIYSSYEPTNCTSLVLTAEDVIGNNTYAIVNYTAVTNGYDTLTNTFISDIVITGTGVSSEFEQNTSTTDSVERTISFTYLDKTATTTITQGVWIDQHYTVVLNNEWSKSTSISNPDSLTYDGVYESSSNYNVHSKASTMYIDIFGCTNFKLYIRSYAESNFDYVMVSQLDETINNNTSYSSSTLVKSHTRGSQNSGTTIGSYKLVEFNNIDEGEHRITIVYRKDGSGNSGTDRGYVLIPRDQ